MTNEDFVGLSFPDDSDLLDRFDDAVVDENYKRSERIREAMELLIAVESAYDATDIDRPERTQTFCFAVRQAILDRDRLERAGELADALDRAESDG